MMKRSIALMCVASGALALASCSSSPKHPEQNEAQASREGIAAPSVKEGETAVKRREVIVREHEEKIPSVATTKVRADINRMDEDHFRALGVPEKVAESIVDYRDDHGNFHQVSDLRMVPGMTENLYNRVKDKLGVSPTG
jgi:competence ComEA-like helix-hairpin-helix protein